jgi:ArsR family transcriptional regulator, arsenate/arsenite/antimonite-responsive transcriptional repressor / arsenate reductase (thioredoxin)
MVREQATGVRRRAAVHAALSDPARLAIVDELTIGDASPSRLSALLDMPSNLLAHHLKVLESQGIVCRAPSAGDRRRTYIRLAPESLRGLLPGTAQSARRVLFVCTANSARSHLAAALWSLASAVPSASAGTHPAARIDPGAIAAAARHGLPLSRLRPRRIDQVRAQGDLVITVCDSAHEELGDRADLHWSVPDPVRAGSDAAFDSAVGELSRRVDDLAPCLIPA